MPSLVAAPAEVRAVAASQGKRGVVDLLPRILADVGDHEVAGLPVEGVPPWIADAVGEDLGKRGRLVDERVVGRNLVRISPQRVDAHDLSEPLREVLPPVVGIAPTTAVPCAEVEVAVGAE